MNTPFKVLSLEDSDLDFEIISEQLIKAGFNPEISRAETGQEFTELIRNNTYDIILADYNLPQFNAFEALKICNKHCPEVPFICVSGSIGEILAIELLKMGAVDYVIKDRLERLPFAVKRALDEAKEKKALRLAQEELKQSEERLRDIIFSTADWVWEVDDQGRYTYSSQRDIDLFDVAPDEIIGKTPFDFMPPEEASRIGAVFSKIVAGKLPIKDLENWNIGKNGEPVCLLTNGLPILDKEGRLIGYRGVDKNITEKKNSEEIIRQSEAKLSYSQQIAKMGSWDFNLKTNKYTWSKNMYLMLGYEPGEAVDYNNFINLVHPDDRQLIDFYMNEIVKTKNGVSFDFRYVLPDKIMWVQNNLEPVFRNDELIELHGVNIDITDKKQAEQELISAKDRAEASDRLKTAFMNNISHEIRTPLNGILGFGQILADPEFPAEEKAEFYKMLEESSDRLLNTITNIMDISLLASGNQKIYRENFSIDRLIHEVYDKFEFTCKQKNLVFLIPKETVGKSTIIHSDEFILSKILTQLIDNSIKFTSNGTIEVNYELKENTLLLSVQDSGIGIAEKYKSQIFDNFMQEDNDNTRRYEGSGIGLSIVKGLTEMLGGHILLESEKGLGSKFTLSIPVA
jgi:PAS domain S-box-containing protein